MFLCVVCLINEGQRLSSKKCAYNTNVFEISYIDRKFLIYLIHTFLIISNPEKSWHIISVILVYTQLFLFGTEFRCLSIGIDHNYDF